MCERGDTRPVVLPDGRTVPVDSCIQPLVQALNLYEVTTTGSCCGHGEKPGMIALADGRMLLVCQWPEEKQLLAKLKEMMR